VFRNFLHVLIILFVKLLDLALKISFQLRLRSLMVISVVCYLGPEFLNSLFFILDFNLLLTDKTSLL